MRLTTIHKPRSHVRAFVSISAGICLFSLSNQVAVSQDIPVVAVSEKVEEQSSTASAATAAVSVIVQSDTDIYQASFFDQYTPQNAFDMIKRLPGFSFDGGSNARGFGGTAGNVLIDGSRPTSKSSSLQDSLQRIPAAQVERIEIIRGGVSGGEAAGQSVVANVIRKSEGSSGTWNLITRRSPDGRVRPRLEATLTTKLGGWDTSFDLDIGLITNHRVATIESYDADGNLTKSEYETRPDGPRRIFTSGEASRDFAGGKLTLNGRLGVSHWQGKLIQEGYFNRLPDDGPLDDYSILDQDDTFREAELGIDWTKTNTNNWKWRLIGLGRLETVDYSDTYEQEDFTTGDTYESAYEQDRKRTEYIFRTTFGNAGAGKFRPEFGVEFANNRLDTEADFIENEVFDDLFGSDVVVDEIRGEAFSTFNYAVTDKLTIDGGITFEASRIKVTGDADNSQKLSFWKPRLSGTYSFNDDVQLNIEAEREVGQLDFNRFAADNDSQDQRATGGNPNLQPDKKDRIALTLDWNYSERGSIKAKVYHQWRKDILEEIILGDGSFGTGNAGDAKFYGWEIEGNIPLDSFLKGGLLDIKYRERYSSFDDPILIDGTRIISDYSPSWLDFELRQDIVKHRFAWGVRYWGSFREDDFRVDEIDRFQGNKRLRFYVETTRFFGVKMMLQVHHANTGKYTRTRTFFQSDANRGGEITGYEISRRKRKPEVRFDISGTF